mgnify:CR=1 FL=1
MAYEAMSWLVFALHGNQPRYVDGMVRNVELIPRIYGPGWSAVVYHDHTVPGHILAQLRSSGLVALRPIGETTRPSWAAYEGRFWRLLALEDPLIRKDHGALVCHRDADSRISSREVQAVMDWHISGHLVHIMRDHPHHTRRPLLAGMWDWRVSPNPARLAWIVEVADRYLQNLFQKAAARPWGNDLFMGRWIYPKLRKVALQHDTFGSRGLPFPGLTTPGPFVGEVVHVEGKLDKPYLPDREIRDKALRARGK